MNFLKIIGTVLTTYMLYFFILPFRFLIKRNENLIIIVGRDNGKLLDNCKYILQGLNASHIKSFYYLTKDKNTAKLIVDAGMNAHIQSINFRTFILLLKAGIVIVDSLDWSKKGWHLLYQNAKIIQLWHGIPLKEIEFQKAKSQIIKRAKIIQILAKLFWQITNRFPVFYALIATSDFSGGLLSKCINTKELWITGYPRNDVLLKEKASDFDLLNTDLKATLEISRAKSKYQKVILFSPTFRDGFSNPLKNNGELLKRIDATLRKHNISLFVKLHPWISDESLELFENIRFIKPDSDIYPLLSKFDLLITDYSSIYFDFLLIDRPVVFFPYDLNNYLKDERKLMIDYESFTPGKKAFSLPQLIKLALSALKHDSDKIQRAKLRELMFKNIDAYSSERVVRKILSSTIQ